MSNFICVETNLMCINVDPVEYAKINEKLMNLTDSKFNCLYSFDVSLFGKYCMQNFNCNLQKQVTPFII